MRKIIYFALITLVIALACFLTVAFFVVDRTSGDVNKGEWIDTEEAYYDELYRDAYYDWPTKD